MVAPSPFRVINLSSFGVKSPHTIQMASQKIYRSTYPPSDCPTNISLSQFLTIYNPDAVSPDKVILEDDWTGRSLTYSELRENSAKHAWSLRHMYGIEIGDVVAISGLNSVSCATRSSLWMKLILIRD